MISNPLVIQCECRQCRANFSLPAHAVRRGRGQFCSRACSTAHARHMRHNVHKRPHPKRGAATAAELYERHVIRRGQDECWGWSAFKFRGYGRISLADGSAIGAHRVSFEIAHGPIPSGLTVLHACDNPECTNPRHLRLGTNADNNADRDMKGRTARGSRSGKAVLTEGLVVLMRNAYRAGGETHRTIADRFNVNQSTVAGVLRRRTWRHVP